MSSEFQSVEPAQDLEEGESLAELYGTDSSRPPWFLAAATPTGRKATGSQLRFKINTGSFMTLVTGHLLSSQDGPTPSACHASAAEERSAEGVSKGW